MFARSMPPPTPKIRIAKVSTSATICHPLLPNAEAIAPKEPLNPSTESGASVAPVNVPTIYLKIQPMTTV